MNDVYVFFMLICKFCIILIKILIEVLIKCDFKFYLRRKWVRIVFYYKIIRDKKKVKIGLGLLDFKMIDYFSKLNSMVLL